MIEFRRKNFSLLSSIIGGASTGAGIGLLGSKVSGPEFRKKFIGQSDGRKGTLIAMGAGAIIGAALGALSYTFKEINLKINRKRTVNDRLMKVVVENLLKDRFKEGKDFTRDPKIADQLKTRVCIVMSRVSDDLRVLINTVSDSKLKRTTDEVITRIPNVSVVNKKMTDKFNDITISTISDSSADASLVTGIAEHFIHSGYPVYLVEVG
jgi:hypothetical protein